MNDLLKTFLSVSLTGTVLTALLLMLKPIIKDRVSKAFSYYIWLVVLVRLALPFGYAVSLPEFSKSVVVQTAGEQAVVSSQGDTAIQQTQPKSDITTPATITPDAPVKQHTFSLKAFITDKLWAIWLCGAIISILRYMIAYLLYVRKVRLSRVKAQGEALELFEGMSNGKPRLYYSGEVSTPMLIGLFKPCVILPQKACTSSELENIFRHELTHYRRHDIAYKWFTAAVTSLHWFNPAVYFIRRETLHMCELSCDEAVIRSMTSQQRKAYGNTLLALASSKKLPYGVTASTMCEEKKQLKGRLLSIMKFKKTSAAAIAVSAALLIALAGCASTVVKTDTTTGTTTDATTAQEQTTAQTQSKLEYTVSKYSTAPNEKSSVAIEYPVFTGTNSEKLNAAIDSKVKSFATIDTDYFSADEGLTVDYKTAVTLNDGKTVSIIFWGNASMETSAYPTTNLNALNIDLSTMQEIKLSDLYTVNSEFGNVFFEKAYYPENPETSYDKASFSEMLSMQKDSDTFAYPEYISFFLKPDSIVLTMSAVHATGSDHFEGEIKNSDISQFAK